MRIKHNHDLAMKDRPVTAQRQLLLDIIREARGHLDAKEVYRRAVDRDRRISLATVYRNLRLFKELRLVDEIRLDELHCFYEIRPSTEHYHLVCTACGRVIEFESPLIGRLVAEVERNCGFRVGRAVLRFEGCCQGCGTGEKAS
jgi:Fur family peroxide stress response transcriptional regulator